MPAVGRHVEIDRQVRVARALGREDWKLDELGRRRRHATTVEQHRSRHRQREGCGHNPAEARQSSGHQPASRRLRDGRRGGCPSDVCQCPLQVGGRLKTRGRRLFKQTQHNGGEVGRHPGCLQEIGRIIVQDGVERVDGVLARERALAGRHLEQHRSQREEIRPAVDGVSADLFRRQVAGRPEQHARQRREAVGHGRAVCQFGDPEIKNLGHARSREKDIVRFQIAVDQAGRMRDNKTGGDVAGDPRRLFCRQRAAPESYAQGFAVEKLGDQVRPSVEHADVEDLDDVRVVERGGDTCLLQEPFDALRVVRAGVGQKLQRNVPLQAHVRRTVDITHASARHQADNSIRSDKGVDAQQRVILGEIAGRERERRRFEESRQPGAGRRQRVGLGG